MKKRSVVTKIIAAVFAIMILPFSPASGAVMQGKEKNSADVVYRGWIDTSGARRILTIHADSVQAADGTFGQLGEDVYLKSGDTLRLPVNLVNGGQYALLINYRVADGRMADSTLTVIAADKTVLTPIYGLWQDETKEYSHDRYGNEVTPNQRMLHEFVEDYVRDSKSMDFSPVIFSFPAGDSVIELKNADEDVYFRSAAIVSVPDVPDYKDYLSKQTKYESAQDTITVEAEDYSVKSDSYIRVQAKQNAAVKPYSPYQKLLSTLDAGSYNSVGQRVLWNFDVPENAWYHIAFHYSQSVKEGQSVYRDIEIDGKPLFQEMNSVGFSYTGNQYANLTLSANGEAMRVYLEKGRHTIALFTEAPDMQSAISTITELITELSDIGLGLQQIAGSNADNNRSWDIESYMPGVTKRLENIRERLLLLYDSLGKAAGTTPASCINLKQAASIIEQCLKKPQKLPSNVSQISVGNGSATELLAALQNSIREQGMELDCIYFYGETSSLPAPTASFFEKAAAGIKRFFYSLFHSDGAYAATVGKDVLNVWVNRSVTHVETIQSLADSYFTPETGIKVQMSIMPDAGKLLLANASNTCPDVALGLPNATPYQLGLRGAATSLSEFSELENFANQNFNLADLEPYIYDGKVYGLPETMQFYVLMYRTDIFEKLGLSVPDTWDDIANLMPVLRRNGMNCYLPVSSYTGTKGLDGILPFFYQTNTKLFSDDGMTASFHSGNGIKAFETLTDLYSLYSLQNNMPSFYNNFRYGTCPVGVANFTNYMQILYAAPEIADLWAIAPAPGTLSEDGTVCRQQMSVDRGALIMESTDKKQEAWEFLRWWLSSETQIEFSHTLLVKFGADFIWNSANKDAFSHLAIPTDDRAIIIKQWEQAQNYRNLPVTYMLERELSDAWYAVVERGTPPRIALNQAAANVNSELKIKMKEFRYTDASDNMIREYDMRPVKEILSGVNKK